jgi:hypothetical protein
MNGPSIIVSAQERRVVRRATQVRCQIVAEHGFRLLGSSSLDLSDEGMLFRSDEPVELGEEVIVSLQLPGRRLYIDAEAEVARIARGMRLVDRGRAIGLRFRHMDRMDRALLGASLHGLPPPIPLRRLRADYAATVFAIGR